MASRTNYAKNPRFHANVSDGLVLAGFNAPARVVAADLGLEFPRGCVYAADLTCAVAGVAGYIYLPTNTPATCLPTAPGDEWTLHAAFHVPDFLSGGSNSYFDFMFYFYDAGGAIIGSGHQQTHHNTDTVGFTPDSYTYTAPALAAFCKPVLRFKGETTTQHCYVTQLAIWKENADGFWFCGETPGFGWDGATDNSSSSGDGLYEFNHPGIVLDDAYFDELRPLTVEPGTQTKLSYESFLANYMTSVTASNAFAGPKVYADKTTMQTDMFGPFATDAKKLIIWALAYQLENDPALKTTYATRVRNMLLSWQAVWLPNDIDTSPGLNFNDVCQVGYDQSPRLFRFAWAYDLTRADAVYDVGSDRADLDAWFRECGEREWTYLPYRLNWNGATGTGNYANDHSMVDYEWRPSLDVEFLHYRRSDKNGPGGDFGSRYIMASLACAYAGGDYQGVARLAANDAAYYATVASESVEHYLGYSSAVDHAIVDAIMPVNEGDYRDIIGTYAPQQCIQKRPLASGADTTDYMSFNNRIVSILAMMSDRLYADLGSDGAAHPYATLYATEFRASWEYVARLFAPNAVTSPVFDADNNQPDTINYSVGKPRFPLGVFVTRSPRVSLVSSTNEGGVDPIDYWETEFAGPTNLLWNTDLYPPLEVVGGVPAVSSFTPIIGPPGTAVVVTGTDLLGATSVTVNGVAAAFYVMDSTHISLTIPAASTTGRIAVTTSYGTGTSATDFTVEAAAAPPIINSFSPSSGHVGDSVLLIGDDFDAGPDPVVKFRGIVAQYTQAIHSGNITAVVPAGAETGPITIETIGGIATTLTDFVVIPTLLAPTISSVSPATARVGAAVTIIGTDFTGATSVTFGGVPALGFVVSSSTHISVMVPVGALSGPVVVTTPLGSGTSPVDFTVATGIVPVAQEVTLRNLVDQVCDNVGAHRDYEKTLWMGDGETTRFKLKRRYAIDGSVTVDSGAILALDYDSGLVQLAEAPARGVTVTALSEHRALSERAIVRWLNQGFLQLFEDLYFYVLPQPDTSITTVNGVYEYDFMPEGGVDHVAFLEYKDEDGQWMEERDCNLLPIPNGVKLAFDDDPGDYQLRITYVQRPRPFLGADYDLETIESTTGLPANAAGPAVLWACYELMTWAISASGRFNIDFASTGAVASVTAAAQGASMWKMQYTDAAKANRMKVLPLMVRG